MIGLFKNRSDDMREFVGVVNLTLGSNYSDFFSLWLRCVGFPLLNAVELFDTNQESYTGAIYRLKVRVVD